MRLLQSRVGQGPLRMQVTVDQIYAEAQEETPYRHPRGGGPRYMRRTLDEEAPKILREGAGQLFQPFGLRRAFAAGAGRFITTGLGRHAPVRYGNLRRSGRARVYDNGAMTFSRGPAKRRLSKTELNAQANREAGE